jgi:hypothetical protein
LWCAGTAGALSAYPTNTYGLATFNLTQTADYYSSQLDFYYLMPSVGAGEANNFLIQWQQTGSGQTIPVNSAPVTTSWKTRSYDLSAAGNQSLARAAGSLWFKFEDINHVDSPATGAGPTVDNVLVSGWKYGSPRSVIATAAPSSVELTWAKPYRSVIETVVDTRSVAYRVWRAPASTEAWTELTGTRTSATTYSDPLPGEGASYRYSVQPWDTGTGTGYGQAIDSTVSVTAHAPTVSMATPGAGFTIAAGSPVVISGNASDVGTGLDVVKIRIRQADGQCWTGSMWTAVDYWVAASSANGYSTWTYSWTPTVGDVAKGQIITVTPKAFDKAALSTTGNSVSSAAPAGASVSLEDGAPYTKQTQVSVAVSAAGAAYMQHSVDGGAFGPWGPSASSDSVTIAAVEGSHSVTYQFSSAPNGPSEASASDSIGFDSTAPEVTITSPSSSTAPDAIVSVQGTSSDAGSGVDSVKVSLSSGGKYWNGYAWQDDPFTIDATSSNGFATWTVPTVPSGDLMPYLPITVEAVSTDALGNASAPTAASSLDPLDPVALTFSVSPTTLNYGAYTTVSGVLTSQGAPLVGRSVELLYYSSGTWKRLTAKSTNSSGEVAFVTRPVSKNKTYFRLRFTAAGFQSVTTAYRYVMPRPYVGVPTKPSVVYRNRSFTSRATLNPRHTAGTRPVRILCYRYEKGKWVYRRGFWAKAYNYSSYSRVYTSVKIPYSGTWKMRAYAPADSRHAVQFGSYSRTFKVK